MAFRSLSRALSRNSRPLVSTAGHLVATPAVRAASILSPSTYTAISSCARGMATQATPTGKLPDIDSKKLSITLTKNPKPKVAKETLKFGQTLSDHMLEVDWTSTGGWGAPRIVPYGPLAIDPAASVFHYGLECFEGMKAYVDESDQIRMFRPEMNMARMNSSNHRLLMPAFDGVELLACIQELLRVEKSWIPRGYGYSLYIRPTCISTHAILGVAPAQAVKIFVLCSPVGPYYPEGFNPVKLLADPKYARAWPGGTGATKVGGNYAMGIRPAWEAAQKGYQQLLWLYGEDMQVTEVGTMNQFFFWKTKDGKRELVTAPLDGTILPGVTRDSILQLARGWGEFTVVERKYTIHEVVLAVEEGRMIESFGAGTAAIVSPVKAFAFNGKEYAIPLNKDDPTAKAGALTQRISDTIMGIQYGKIPHPWSVVVPNSRT